MVPYLRAANVKDGELELTDVKEMNFDPAEQVTFALRPGDILITEGSGSLAAVGASAVWGGELPGTVCFQNTLIRLRPRQGITDGRYLGWWARSAHASGQFASIASGANIYHVSAERVKGLQASLPPLDEQRRIADFLDVHVGRIDRLSEMHQKILWLGRDRIDSRIRHLIGHSKIFLPSGGSVFPLKRLLVKLNRPVTDTTDIVTAFRDGQVVARDARRSEGYTDSATTEPQGQGVEAGDVVVHGLDGFAGAIGDSESAGNCSPAYHVCLPLKGGDSAFYGHLLRIFAVDGYLSLYGGSARERAIDFRNWGRFGSIPIPLVPPGEQREIGNSIRSLRPLRDEISRLQALLAQRRQALITAAVTGQIDVTTARGVAV